MKTNDKWTLFSLVFFIAVFSSCVGTGISSQPASEKNRTDTSKQKEITSIQQAAMRASEAYTHYENREWQSAIEKFTHSIAYVDTIAEPEGRHGQYLVSWYSGLAMAWKHEGDLARARSYADKARAVAHDPKFSGWIGADRHMKYVLASCRIYDEQKDYASAILEMTNYIEKYSIDNFAGPYPSVDYSYYYRGMFYYHAGDYEKAANDFDIAVSRSGYHYDEIDDHEQPWEIMSEASLKARGKNSYIMIIRDTDEPGNLEINERIFNDETVRKYQTLRRSIKSRELIIREGRYEVKAPDKGGLILTGSRRVSDTEIIQYYRETITSGQVFHSSYHFLPGLIYTVTPWEITIIQEIP